MFKRKFHLIIYFKGILFKKSSNHTTEDVYPIIGTLFSLFSTFPDVFNLIVNLYLNRKFLEESKTSFRSSLMRSSRKCRNMSIETNSIRKQTSSSLGRSCYTIVNSNTDANISKGLRVINRPTNGLEMMNYRMFIKRASMHSSLIVQRRACSMNSQYIIANRRCSMVSGIKENLTKRRLSLPNSFKKQIF